MRFKWKEKNCAVNMKTVFVFTAPAVLALVSVTLSSTCEGKNKMRFKNEFSCY